MTTRTMTTRSMTTRSHSMTTRSMAPIVYGHPMVTRASLRKSIKPVDEVYQTDSDDEYNDAHTSFECDAEEIEEEATERSEEEKAEIENVDNIDYLQYWKLEDIINDACLRARIASILMYNIRLGLDNCERAKGGSYKIACARVLFDFIVTHESKLSILGRAFVKVLQLKLQECADKGVYENGSIFHNEIRSHQTKLRVLFEWANSQD